MPPKDAKGKGKGATVAAKVVDPLEYQRPPVPATAVAESMSLEAEKCKIKNTESLFVEWAGIEAEPWGEAHPAEVVVSQPAYLTPAVKSVNCKTFFALEVEVPVDPKAKAPPAKKDAKKGAGPATVEIKDEDANEGGVTLPKIYIDNGNSTYEGYSFSHPFASNPSDNSKRIDEIMCSAFEFVAQFASHIFSSPNACPPPAGTEFLWKSIYPKNAAGKPCYSPMGKYFVRLFLAGKWRKIPVDDLLPVGEDGAITLAASSNKYELWPTIISKAVYLVLNKCGYTINKTELSCAESGSILGFIVHLLTGWTPSSPLQVSQLWSSSLSELDDIFQEMVSYKVALFQTQDIPEDLEALAAAIPSNSISVDEKVVMKTKKELKEDFQRQKDERDAMEQRIISRETKLSDMANSLSVPVFEASFLSFLDSTSKLNILPILGMHHPDSNFENISLLVKFKVNQKVDVNKGNDSNTPTWKVQLPNLPNCTAVDATWVSLKNIIQFNPVLVSIDTHLVQKEVTQLGWHWKGAAPVVEDAKGGKDKGKKGGAPEPVKDPAAAEVCEDPGQLPPVLLSIDTKALVSSEGADTPLYIPLSIFIHADTFEEASGSGVGGFCNIKDNVVLLARELNSTSEEGPFVMRVELCASNAIPVTRVTFQIPTSRIPQDGKPFLFLVRLFTSSSVYITFHSALPLNIGPADEIWKGLGLNAYTFGGDATVTKPGTENIIFRLPLDLDSSVSSEISDDALVLLHVPSRKLGDLITLLSIPRAGHGSSNSFPLGTSAAITLSSGDITLLVAAISAYSLAASIPSFPWKISVLSTSKLNNPTLCNNVSGTQMYAGTYNGNSKLCLFNEIYAVDKASFPMALRLNIESLSEFFTPENIWLKLQVKRKSDKAIISEHSSRGVLPLYLIDASDITGEETVAAAAAPVDPKAKKDDKKGAKGAVAVETIDVILECSLDETKMVIPPEWRTRYPRYFDLKLPSYVAGNPQIIKWSVNVLCGTVSTVTHDISELEKQAAEKNSWEEKMEGREERAKAAASAYQLKKALYLKEARTEGDIDPVADVINIALNTENKDIMKEKQRSIFATSEFKEIINPLIDGESKELLDDTSIQKYKDSFTEIAAKREETFESYRKSLVSLNDMTRNATKLRSEAIMTNCVENANEIAAIWQDRETYRAHIVKFNAALKFLIDKGSEVVQAEQDKEDEANGIKKDKKAAKKK